MPHREKFVYGTHSRPCITRIMNTDDFVSLIEKYDIEENFYLELEVSGKHPYNYIYDLTYERFSIWRIEKIIFKDDKVNYFIYLDRELDEIDCSSTYRAERLIESKIFERMEEKCKAISRELRNRK